MPTRVSPLAAGRSTGAPPPAAATGGDESPAAAPSDGNQSRLGYDFVFDTCADGRTLKCLTVVDEFTRECLAIDVAGGIRSDRVIEVLAQLVSVHGPPLVRPLGANEAWSADFVFDPTVKGPCAEVSDDRR